MDAVRVGVMLPRDLPLAQVVPFARDAEALGFAELWVVEDLGFRGGVAQAATVLAATSSIEVGIGILPAGARNAAFAAMEIGTLAQLHPGRVVAGIGHGMPHWMRDVGAWPRSPLTLLGEYTVALRALLRGEPVDDGRYVQAAGLRFDELPDVVPPVLLGVRGPRSLELAGAVSDGVVLAEPAPPAYISAAIERMRAGGAVGTPRVVTYDVAAVADDAGAALEAVRPALAVVGEPDWAPHLVGLPFAGDLAALRADAGDPAEFARRLPREWISALALAGTPDDVRAGIRARHEAGATTTVLTPVGGDRLHALTHLARVL